MEEINLTGLDLKEKARSIEIEAHQIELAVKEDYEEDNDFEVEFEEFEEVEPEGDYSKETELVLEEIKDLEGIIQRHKELLQKYPDDKALQFSFEQLEARVLELKKEYDSYVKKAKKAESKDEPQSWIKRFLRWKT